MKKGLIILGVVVIIFVFATKMLANFTDNVVVEQKERLEGYADLLKGQLPEPGETYPSGELVIKLPEDKEISCENVYLVDKKYFVLNKCTVDAGKEKICYYKDKSYECDDKKYKDLYSKLDFDNLKEITK